MKNFNKKQKTKVIVTINSTANNTILLARDNNNKILAQSSLGLVIKKRRGKKSIASGAQLSSEFVTKKLIEQGYSEVSLRVKGFGRGRESALFGFSSSALRIEEILDVTPTPHNGCRLKKSRRI